MPEPVKPIYLDHNASTPLLPEVLQAMLPYLADHHGNPSSPHLYGRILRQAIDRAREQVASLIDCSPGEILFTSGGTEANNLAIRGTALANPGRRRIITSVVEHPATSAPCAYLEEQGYRIDRAPVDNMGAVDLQFMHQAISTDALLVTVMHANSETGTLQPIGAIADIAQACGALLHTDAAQSLGKVEVSVRRENVDLLSIAGHKLYAPHGVGALFIKAGTTIKPLLLGAGHENGLRPGTENVASIVGLGQACAAARRDLSRESQRVERLRDRLWEQLKNRVPGIALNGHPVSRLPNTLNVRFPGVSGNDLLAACPSIAASTGSACHAAGASASAVILAMGIPGDEAIGSVRLSLGRENNEGAIEQAATELAGAWQSLKKGSHGERAI